MLDQTTKEVMLHFLYSKIDESNAVDEDGNVKEQNVIELDEEHHITVAETYQLIGLLEEM